VENQRLDLGVVTLHAESFGEPGKRTFRLQSDTGEGQVWLWLEKEQLAMLGSAIDEILQRVPAPLGASPESTATGRFMGELEVRVGSLTLGYDREQDGFTLEAGEFESAFSLESITLIAARADLERVSQEIASIVAAGRPRCPLCGTPLGGSPHFCPPSNGHTEVTVSR
jgi:uncharacterized repeat protein (TIGR03847 family)